ncbi:hypothetical protein PHJA_001439600 [Phtheirospermum japonicum]|uniref:Uncharacterized protein n=1 Tax=Phtheirospermum japonicum TaxID=374723 RepID=A0A830CAF0_9LAMI|nr:hypothetical protein PHJA_001439600 [Phtheirospermum japonicum]
MESAEIVLPRNNCASSDIKPVNGAEIVQSEKGTGSHRTKRCRKPNSLLRPEEGYAHIWTRGRQGSSSVSHERNNKAKEENKVVFGKRCRSNKEKHRGKIRREITPQKDESGDVADKIVESHLAPEKNETFNGSNVEYAEEMVSARIKVWWPLDKTFYTGTVEAFDPLTKRHKIKYDDEEEEVLNLSEERWELFNERPQQEAESILVGVWQGIPWSEAVPLRPLMTALITEELFWHADVNIQVEVASCFSELARITAPTFPYADEIPEANQENFTTELNNGNGSNDNNPTESAEIVLLRKNCASSDIKPVNGAEIVQSEKGIGSHRTKRCRKLNSLLRPEEGYAHIWMRGGQGSPSVSHDCNNKAKEENKVVFGKRGRSNKEKRRGKIRLEITPQKDESGDVADKIVKSHLAPEKEETFNGSNVEYGEEMVNARIMIKYDDDEEEVLNLREER